MSERPSSSEKPKEEKQETVAEPDVINDGARRTGELSPIQKEFQEAMKIEDIKEAEIERLRADVKKRYKDVPDAKINRAIQSPKIQDGLEEFAKERLAWEEKKKRLYLGVIDLQPVKELFQKFKSFFKK